MERRKGARLLPVIRLHRPIHSKRILSRYIPKAGRRSRRILRRPATPAIGCDAIKIFLPLSSSGLCTTTRDFSICRRRSSSNWSSG